MRELIKILLDSPKLHDLVGEHIYPNHTTYLGDCIVYSYETTYNSRAVKRQRLTLNIIVGDLEKAEAIETEVGALLLTLGDAPLTHNVIHVEQNGGGSLFDTGRNKNHRILYFDVVGHSGLE
ncbi:MAG: hypothetical protein MJZ55_00245 [Paludibacteraceae bacterium]|nr:hypothetical protein [Paludibacteraceae bacterium]